MSDTTPQKTFTLYGIKNCDTVKKARRWLEDQEIPYQFHDYRVDGLSPELLQIFIEQAGWEALLNTRGTTWRKLTDEQKSTINNAEAAKALMLEQPAIIKRPLLVSKPLVAKPVTSKPSASETIASATENYLLGFKAEQYQQFFSHDCSLTAK
ncbi:ArsC family reductase [Xenorhabdus cabanillasii]|uniref:Protein yffB n=1 Tax=Xenorhabdus cabanillasii JM26 TaxID=1427517 RepID=W1JC28_9GAMM|nr:ArsC family reductase [Xenorhabdus cabanillasii]PHM78348.1 arsenate reductase [Xenorhabdus cabanillasii JM26]CDL87698.1 Protein yffB [Xenorhabdus cabanillasii JM26]